MDLSKRPAAIRILLVDDHRSVLWGLAKLIESAAGLELVATCSCVDSAAAALRERQPDVVLLDLDLGEGSGRGLEHVTELSRHGAAKIIVLTGLRDPQLQEQAVLRGARGFVHKSEPAEVILKAIAHVHAGEVWLDRATVGKVFSSFSAVRPRLMGGPRDGRDALTPGERKVIAQVVRHKSAPNKIIADALGISTHTLRNHLASIYGKLSLNRRLDLVLYAIDRKLDRDPA